jgi:hypothetical protein
MKVYRGNRDYYLLDPRFKDVSAYEESRLSLTRIFSELAKDNIYNIRVRVQGGRDELVNKGGIQQLVNRHHTRVIDSRSNTPLNRILSRAFRKNSSSGIELWGCLSRPVLLDSSGAIVDKWVKVPSALNNHNLSMIRSNHKERVTGMVVEGAIMYCDNKKVLNYNGCISKLTLVASLDIIRIFYEHD